MITPSPPIVLTIAGSDSGGGAGIQADLRTFAAYGLHGLSVITAITAQNTQAVQSIYPVPIKQLNAQLEAVFSDFPIAAVKIGMLGNSASVLAIANCLRKHLIRQIVLDPVMVASSGARLLNQRALSALKQELIPLAEVFTPNLPEAGALLRTAILSKEAIQKAGAELLSWGPRAVLIKGGHSHMDQLSDYYADDETHFTMRHRRLPFEAHGTGCTLSAAIAANLAQNHSRATAVRKAVTYVQNTLRHAYRPGKGALHVLGYSAI